MRGRKRRFDRRQAAFSLDGFQQRCLFPANISPRPQAHFDVEIQSRAENILGSGLDFNIEMRLGAGAYICGEETALLESIEGKRGLPPIKPPFPTTHGLFGKPTVINNVETFCNVPLIIEHGALEYRKIGTERSPRP